MYASKVPFTRDGSKGPKPVGAKAKKASKPAVIESVVEEPAKIDLEPIDLIIEVEAVEEEADANS